MGFKVETGIQVDFDVNLSPIEKAIQKVTRLEKKLAGFGNKKIRVDADVTKAVRSSKRLQNQLFKTNKSLNDVERTAHGVGRSYEEAGAKADNFGKKASRAGDRTRRSFVGLKSVIVGAMSAISARKLIDVADESSNLNNRLKLLTSTESGLIDMRKKLLNISNNTRTSLKDSVPLYYTLTTATEKLGLAESKRLELLQTINKLNKIGGTGEASISAAMIQLNQGLSSGVLRGEELNSILEQTPRLAKALSDGLGVGVGDLKKLGEAGVLTTERVTTALLSQTQKANAEFGKLGTTVGQASTVFANSFRELVGGVDKSLGITKELTNYMNDLSRAIISNKTEIIQYFKESRDTLKEWLPIIKNIGIALIGLKIASVTKSFIDMGVAGVKSLGGIVTKLKTIQALSLNWGKILGIASLSVAVGVVYGQLGELGAVNVATTHAVASRSSKSLQELIGLQKTLQDRIASAKDANILDKFVSDDYRRVDELKRQLDAVNKKINVLNNNKIKLELDTTSIDKGKATLDRYYKTLGKVESNNNYKATQGNRGSYRGKYQFNEKSATEFLQKMGKSWDDYLNNPAVQEKVIQMETDRNVKILEQFKVPISEFSLFLAHNIGATGTGRVLTNQATSSDMSHIRNQSGMNKKSTVQDYLNKFSKIFDTKIIEVKTVGDTALKSIQADKEIQAVLDKSKNKNSKQASANAEAKAKAELKAVGILEKEKLLHQEIAIQSKNYGNDRLAQLKKYVAEDKARVKYEEALLKKGVSKDDIRLLEAKRKLASDQSRLIKEASSTKLNGIDSSLGTIGSKINSLVSKLGDGISKAVQPLLDALGLDGSGIMSSISSLFGGGADLGSMFSGFLTDFSNTALGSILDGFDLNSTQSALITSGNPYATALGALGKLLSSTVSEAEIKNATGRHEFGGVPLSDLKTMYTEALSPSVTIARSQLKLLEDLNTSFSNFDFSGKGSDGVAMDGSSFKPDSTNILGGLYSSSTTLLGAGVEAEAQKLSDFLTNTNVNLYTSTLKKTSSLFGLIETESIDVKKTDAPPKLKALIKDSVENRIQSAVDSLETIGIDTTKFNEAMKNQIFELGKVDFKDLNQDEKSQALQQAIAESTNKMIKGALGTSNEYLVTQLEGFGKAGEDVGDTLGRVALDFETVKGQMGLFGVEINTLVESEAIVKAAGGLQQFSQGMATFRSSFFTPEEQRAMNQVELETALMKYNVVLPASKEEFKQLVITTAQKIKTLKTDIEIRKAELRAQINGTKLEIELKKAGLDANAKMSALGVKISMGATSAEVKGKAEGAKAVQEVTKGRVKVDGRLVDSMNAVGGASVTFGNNLHRTIKAIAKGSAKAIKAQKGKKGKGDVNFDAIADKALTRMQAELGKLEGLYGTLMGNMSGFADFYGSGSDGLGGGSSGVGGALGKTKQTAKQATDAIIEYNKAVSSSAMSLGLADKNLLTVAGSFDDTADSVVESVKKLSQALTTLGKNTDKTYTKQMQVLQMQAGAGGESELNSALDLYRKTFFSKEKLLFDDKVSLLKSYREVGVKEIPATKDDLKKLIDNFQRGTPDLDYKYGKLLSLTQNFLNLRKEIDATTKELKDLKTSSRDAVLNFGTISSKDLKNSLFADLESNDFKSAKKSFSDYIKSVKKENLSEKQKVFKIAEANNLIQDKQIKEDSPTDELKRLNAKVDELIKIEKSVNTHVDKVAENGEQAFINGSCTTSSRIGASGCGGGCGA